jgi:putative lipoprotein
MVTVASIAPTASEAPAAEAPGTDAVVTGTIELPIGTTLPVDAVVTVEIQDVSIADVAAEVIAEATPEVTDPAAFEIPYQITYDAAAIEETKTYSVRATIEDSEGSLLYTSDTITPVITNDAPTTDVAVAVVAAPVEPPVASAVPLEESPDLY